MKERPPEHTIALLNVQFLGYFSAARIPRSIQPLLTAHEKANALEIPLIEIQIAKLKGLIDGSTAFGDTSEREDYLSILNTLIR